MKRATNVIRRILRANFVVLLIFFGCLDGLELVEEDTSATTTGMAMRENMKQSILELDDGGDLIQNNATRRAYIASRCTSFRLPFAVSPPYIKLTACSLFPMTGTKTYWLPFGDFLKRRGEKLLLELMLQYSA